MNHLRIESTVQEATHHPPFHKTDRTKMNK